MKLLLYVLIFLGLSLNCKSKTLEQRTYNLALEVMKAAKENNFDLFRSKFIIQDSTLHGKFDELKDLLKCEIAINKLPYEFEYSKRMGSGGITFYFCSDSISKADDEVYFMLLTDSTQEHVIFIGLYRSWTRNSKWLIIEANKRDTTSKSKFGLPPVE